MPIAGGGVSRTGAGRELELGATATPFDHKSRASGLALGARPSRLGAQNALPAAISRAAAAVGAPDRASPREADSDGGIGAEASWTPLRALARRNGVRRRPWRQDDLRFDRRVVHGDDAGSDRQLSEDGDRALISEGHTTSQCRLRPVDGFSLCASSANTRMRQRVDLLPIFSPTPTDSTCSTSDGTDPSLWGQPLHTLIKRRRGFVRTKMGTIRRG